jgi:hypothetical protein
MTDPKDPPGLKYVLECLKKSADNSECWPVYPAEAGAIISTIDRLRKENEELRAAHPEGEERADVLAYLRYARTFPFTYASKTADIIDALGELIEQGHHAGWARKETT